MSWTPLGSSAHDVFGNVADWVIGLDSAASFVIGFVGGVLWIVVKLVIDDRRSRQKCEHPGPKTPSN